MSRLGKLTVGSRAPDFRCDAVTKGFITEVTLSTYINEQNKAWLILLFIPAAFSLICPTEVLAFQNCLCEFRDRNCEVVFVSVDTKHALWHWQNVPRQYGGLGQAEISLLSDPSHKMSRDYGVLIEDEGICLRAMFIIDEDQIVQQATLNNLAVGRSVLEALRLLEAFQAVAKHGVLCPVDWKPIPDSQEVLSCKTNTLTESQDGRLVDWQKEFDGMITDLDAKYKRESLTKENTISHPPQSSSRNTSVGDASNCRVNGESQGTRTSSDSQDVDLGLKDSIKSPVRSFMRLPSQPSRGSSASQGSSIMPSPSPSMQEAQTPRRLPSSPAVIRLGKDHNQPQNPSGNVLAPPSLVRSLSNRSKRNTYESRQGTQVVLEFADPTSSPHVSPSGTPGGTHPGNFPDKIQTTSSQHLSPAQNPKVSLIQASTDHTNGNDGQTRLQATFEVIKRMSSGLKSPSIDVDVDQHGLDERVKSPGYFDVIVDASDA